MARNRYRVFKEQTYDALLSLARIFHYHFINAQARLEVVQSNILRELEYQSSLELDPRTYDFLQRLPLAKEIVLHARQDLVRRLDSYVVEQPELFQRVIGFIETEILPEVIRHGIPGKAHVNTEDALFHDPLAVAMFIDIFSERGFQASVDIHRLEIPDAFDLQTGKIHCRVKKVFRFSIQFKGSQIRRGKNAAAAPPIRINTGQMQGAAERPAPITCKNVSAAETFNFEPKKKVSNLTP